MNYVWKWGYFTSFEAVFNGEIGGEYHQAHTLKFNITSNKYSLGFCYRGVTTSYVLVTVSALSIQYKNTDFEIYLENDILSTEYLTKSYTSGDVDYQIKSLDYLTEAVLDKEKI